MAPLFTYRKRLQSRIRPKSNGLLGTESGTRNNGSTHSDTGLQSHQAPGVAGENEPRPLQLPLIQISSIGWRTIFNGLSSIPCHSKNSILRISTRSGAKPSPNPFVQSALKN